MLTPWLIGLGVTALLCFPGSAQRPRDNPPTPDALAQSALNTVLSDLTQEIMAGSNVVAVGSATLYMPRTAVNVVPQRVGTADDWANLVKTSSDTAPFYTGGLTRAANSPSDMASQNGQSVLASRWNRHFLLPKKLASDTDATPVGASGTAFVTPRWVLVANDGSNPKTISTNVVGRYAYAIYDEGGLLDMTVAGHPSSMTAQQISYKDSLAAADLTQVSLTRAQIDSIVNWRGSHAFTGRLDLIGLLTQTIATDSASRAALQNSLQYLGSYSRGLSQPSYAPVSRVSSSTNPNPRPTILASAAGGNNLGDAYPGASDQDKLSPNFLAIRAQAAFTRNDGTAATAGEPLVKRRFALQRLAWLTYKGPSANRGGVASGTPTDPDTTALVANGIPVTILQQGTAANIQRYFGLTWDGARWMYAGHNRPSDGTSGDAAKGAIHRLDEVAALGTREPDFFELLKATVDLGSLGKASTNGPTADPDGAFAPLNLQYARDINADAAIIQMGANIIDQFDTDGYPTRIVFDDASGKTAREFRGVENLPYLYRIHPGVLKAREAIPTSVGVSTSTADLHSGTAAGYTAKPLLDTGVGLLLAVPDLWNPHDQNSTLGNPRPGAGAASFRVIANSAAPDYIGTGTSNVITVGGYVLAQSAGSYKGNSFDPPGNGSGGPLPPATVAPNAPGFSRVPTPSGGFGTPMTGSNYGYTNPQVIDSSSTSSTLAFNVPDATIFREPTMLATPNVAGSGLSMLTSNPDLTGLQDSNNQNVYKGSSGYYGLTSVNTNPFSSAGGVAPSSGLYTGIYLGAYPLRWVGGRYQNSDRASTGWVYTDAYMGVTGSPVNGITYSVQYQDESGNWVTYDEKYVNTSVFWLNALGALIQPGVLNYTFVDPRTARFGSATENNFADSKRYRAPAVAANWLNTANDVIVTERSDYHSGFGTNFRGTYSAPNVALDWGAYTAFGWHFTNIYNNTTGSGLNAIFFQNGLFAQNNPYWPSDGIRYQGDTGIGATDPTFYSDADGVVRRAMGAHMPLGTTSSVGQPLATASTINSSGRATAIAQSTSRPKVLNRPFRSVAELGCVFSGNPWKNLDFSTPESGYAGLLDVFCINDTDDANGLMAGRLNLNTRQPMVIQAVLSGAYTLETNGTPSAAITATDATDLAAKLTARTSKQPVAGPNTANGPQPLANLSELTGHWNSRQAITYTGYTPALDSNHNIDGKLSYDGFSADFDSLASTHTFRTTPVAAVRESAARALANVGNTRVWNLLIDVIAQTGEYPESATGLDQFVVEGSQRYWLHVAIDRLTGAVVDQSLEAVPEITPTDLTLTNNSVAEDQTAGTVGSLGTVDANTTSVFSYALVSGAGSADNASFTLSGDTLRANTEPRYLDKSSYSIRVRTVDQDGMSLEKTFIITVTPSAYTRWKIANFGSAANDPAVAGDLVDADGDGMPNLLEYALGTSPLAADSSGVRVQRAGDSIQFDYTRSTAATDVTAHAYWTNDLTNPTAWSTNGITETMLSDDGVSQHWRATLPSSAGDKVFLRLQVTRP